MGLGGLVQGGRQVAEVVAGAGLPVVGVGEAAVAVEGVAAVVTGGAVVTEVQWRAAVPMLCSALACPARSPSAR